MGDEATREHSFNVRAAAAAVRRDESCDDIPDRTLLASVAATQLALGPIDGQGYFGNALRSADQ
jgi:hypothetical protein